MSKPPIKHLSKKELKKFAIQQWRSNNVLAGENYNLNQEVKNLTAFVNDIDTELGKVQETLDHK